MLSVRTCDVFATVFESGNARKKGRRQTCNLLRFLSWQLNHSKPKAVSSQIYTTLKMGLLVRLRFPPSTTSSAIYQHQSTMATAAEPPTAPAQHNPLILMTSHGGTSAPAHQNPFSLIKIPVEDSTASRHIVTLLWTQLHKLLARFNKHYLEVLTDVQNGKYDSFTSLAPNQRAGIRVVFREAHLHAVAMMRHQVEISSLVPESDKKHWNDPTEQLRKWVNNLAVDKTKFAGEEFPKKCVWALMVLKVRIDVVSRLLSKAEDGVDFSSELTEFTESAKCLIDPIVAVLPPDELPTIEYL
jgi:hypothetical protein